MVSLQIRAAFSRGEFTLDVDQSFPLDGITALFGPSGGGKSTLLRIIAGFEQSAGGDVGFGEQRWQCQADHQFTPPHLRGVGYVFQDTRLFSHLTVLGNLAYADKRSDGQNAQINLDSVVDALDLSALLKRRTTALSGGEMQRVAIGRALLSRPQLLLMDEPLAALDFKRKAGILPLIAKLPTLFAMPVIYVTHAIEEVMYLANRMIVLSDGKVVGEGPITDMLERNDIQSIIGRFEAAALINAKVARHDMDFQLTELDCGGARITMPYARLDVDSKVRVRIRARDVSLALTKPRDISIQNILSGTVDEIVEEADTAFAEILVDIGGARLRARITRKAVSELKLEIGKPVFALVKSISFDRRAL